MSEFPTGIVTLVFTDLEGSSGLWERYRAGFQVVLQEHNRIIREAAARWHGVEVKTEGDAFFLVFERASDAVRFALEAQLAFAHYQWDFLLEDLGALQVRMGLHTGEPIPGEHPGGAVDYFGPSVNRAARVGAAGHGGQVIVSASTRTLALPELPPELTFEDLGSHRLQGVGEEQLYQLLHPDLAREFPPLKTLAAARHNLPLPATPFIGRTAEIEALLARLRQPATRLLTLLGFGGLGKTRLALQLAELCAGDFADGVWWVGLEEVRDGEAMVGRIAAELRLHLKPQPTVREQLWSFHRDRELLLVLDNTEQIPAAAEVIQGLLNAGPRIKCLVTTRRALELRAERLVEVRPLPANDAAAMFVELARGRRDDFALTAENAGDVAELCRRLEGVPLAIELAASRILGRTPREILHRLDDQLRLLQTGAPDLPPRQRALRATIDWSYGLLSEADRLLLARLAVFAGGYTLKAAEAVCDVDEVQELCSHSLLRRETDAATQQTRYLMLAAVHAYAAEKLNEQPDEADLRLRHADYFVRFAEARVTRLRTPAEPAALAELTAELDNLRAALEWARLQQRGELCARLAAALHHPLYRRGFWAEARHTLQTGVAAIAPGAATAPRLHAALLLHLAGLELEMGEAANAEARAKASLALCRAAGDSAGEADALNLLGLVATEAGRGEVAQTLFEKALSLRQAHEHHGRAIALHNLGRLASRRGDRVEARRLYEAALYHRRAGGDARGEAETLGDLGVVAQESGLHDAAGVLYHDSLAIRRKLNDRLGIALMLHNLAEIAEADGDLDRAIALFIHAERIFRDLQSTFAGASSVALTHVEEQLGEAPFAIRRRAVEDTAWETLIH